MTDSSGALTIYLDDGPCDVCGAQASQWTANLGRYCETHTPRGGGTMDKLTQDMADRAAAEIEALLELRELSDSVFGEGN